MNTPFDISNPATWSREQMERLLDDAPSPQVIRIPFSFFSVAERELIQAANPGVPIEDVA